MVVPAELIVEGIGLEMLTSSYDSSPSRRGDRSIPTIVEFLVVTPIIAAICIYALHQIAEGERPSAGQVLVAGFEAFTPLFAAVALAAAGIALGFVALIVPGVYLAVRWYFVPQTVVIEGARGPQALSRSGLLVTGFWWRMFGLVLLANVAIAIPGFILLAPFTEIAKNTDRAVWALVGSAIDDLGDDAVRGAVLDAPLLRPPGAPSGRQRLSSRSIASTQRSTSASVVVRFDMEMRM